MGAEDEGLKGGAVVGFFWKIAVEILLAFNFLFIGLEERGSPKGGLLAGWGDFPTVKEDTTGIFSFFTKSVSSTSSFLFLSKQNFLFSLLLKCGSSNPTEFTLLSLESKFKTNVASWEVIGAGEAIFHFRWFCLFSPIFPRWKLTTYLLQSQL